MKSFINALVTVGTLTFANASLADGFFPTARVPGDYMIVGVALHSDSENPGAQTKGYLTTVNVMKGFNRCEARQSLPQMVILSNEDTQSASLMVNNEFRQAPAACTEEFQPIFEEVMGYVNLKQGQPIKLDTNTRDFGVIHIFDRSQNLPIDPSTFRVISVEKVSTPFGNNSWRVGTFEIRTLIAGNPCFAENTETSGYAYAVDGVLKIGVSGQTIRENTICTMEYAPVYKKVQFKAAFQKGTIRELVFETSSNGTIEDVRLLKVPDLLR